VILLVAVVAGLGAGLLRARLQHLPYRVPDLKWIGIAFAAFFVQWLVFKLPVVRPYINIQWTAITLIGTQFALLVFTWANRSQSGFWLLGTGLLLNFAVIVANGGLMPITPEAVAHLTKAEPGMVWQVGERLGSSKDIILNAEVTRLWVLSDRYLLLPDGLGYQVVFSLGDGFIAAGAFWLLWTLGGPNKANGVGKTVQSDQNNQFKPKKENDNGYQFSRKPVDRSTDHPPSSGS
jgi:hypothetical protein